MLRAISETKQVLKQATRQQLPKRTLPFQTIYDGIAGLHIYFRRQIAVLMSLLLVYMGRRCLREGGRSGCDLAIARGCARAPTPRSADPATKTLQESEPRRRVLRCWSGEVGA